MKQTWTMVVIALGIFWSSPAWALNVVTTIPDLAAIAAEVGGDEVEVTALAAPNEDPHYVDPRPNLILKLNRADVLITVGLELEDAWLTPLTKQSRNPDIALGGRGRLVASEHVSLIDVKSGKVDRAEGDVHPGGNPHFYCDPRRAIAIAIAMRDRFTELEPDKKSHFEARTRAFVTEAQKLVIAQKNKFERLDEKKRKVVTYHKSLGYLLDWLSLDTVETVEPKPGIPPNPAHVARVLKAMKSGGVGVVVQEEYYPTKTSETLAKLAKGDVVVIEAGTRFDEGESYIEHIRKVTEAIYDALSQ